ncbi:MAG TPA: hypothetical protein VFT16_05505 [Candidatus Saccharimonadales bacterium]|nr:hypothetical protein [Candidatus Saccharimonadales bacterium]
MRYKKNTLYCFSPPVMIATFAIETLLFVYTMIRYRLSPLGRIVGATLVCLAAFQFAEYQVCGNATAQASWSRVGFVAITLLPAMGIHMIQEISGRGSRLITGGGYAASIAFAGLFGLNTTAFAGHVCAGNYAVFQLASPIGGLYFTYYYALLLLGIGVAWYYSDKVKPRIRKALYLQIAGYVSFILPTSVINMINPRTLEGVPSIMCGFAVTYALILVFGIVPQVLTKRAETSQTVRRQHKF